MSRRIWAVERRFSGGLVGAQPGLQDRIFLNYTTGLPICLHQKKLDLVPKKPDSSFVVYTHKTCTTTRWRTQKIYFHEGRFIQWHSKQYVKTINLLCAGNKVFVKFQAQRGGGYLKTPLRTPLMLPQETFAAYRIAANKTNHLCKSKDWDCILSKALMYCFDFLIVWLILAIIIGSPSMKQNLIKSSSTDNFAKVESSQYNISQFLHLRIISKSL